MTWSRRPLVVAVAVLMTASGCSNFAPKADVGVKPVGLTLAFGVDVEKLLEPPSPPTFPTPTLSVPSPTPTGTFTPPPPPPPAPDVCPPLKTTAVRDGNPPASMGNEEFDGEQPIGARPRPGQYLTYFRGNRSGEELKTQYTYRTVTPPGNHADGQSYFYRVLDPFTGMTWYYDVIYETSQAGTSNQNIAGLYLRGLKVPMADEEAKTRTFLTATHGVKLMAFPIEEGDRSVDSQPVPPEDDPDGTIPVSPGGTVLSTTATVAGIDGNNPVVVCDQLAKAWQLNVEINLKGDANLRIVGTLWIATQYGGWPIQENFTMDGGGTLRSGNFFSRLADLDPADPI